MQRAYGYDTKLFLLLYIDKTEVGIGEAYDRPVTNCGLIKY